MKEILDKEIKETYGRVGFFSGTSKRLFELKLIGGEEFLENNLKKGIGGTKLEILKNGSLEINTGSYHTSAVLDIEDLISITIEEQESVYEKKEKSIIGRALIGGLLLGPVGAVVGGMTGIGKKTIKLSDLPDYLVSFKIYDRSLEKEKIILFEFKKKDFNRINEFFNKYFKEKLTQPEKMVTNENTNMLNVADELLKLKKLLDANLLTPEEFENEKQKILSKE